jgi:hypothetical protein
LQKRGLDLIVQVMRHGDHRGSRCDRNVGERSASRASGCGLHAHGLKVGLRNVYMPNPEPHSLTMTLGLCGL